MISNTPTSKKDLDLFEKKVLDVSSLIKKENLGSFQKEHEIGSINDLVKEFQQLCDSDKYNEHYVQIKKITKEIRELDTEMEKKMSQESFPSKLRAEVLDISNLFFDKTQILDDIEFSANERIKSHINFVVSEVVRGHTKDKDIIKLMDQYSDLMSLPENELKEMIFETYLYRIADEALKFDFTNPTFDFLKDAIQAKVQDLEKIHFPNDNNRELFDRYLSQLNERQWDNMIKSALQ